MYMGASIESRKTESESDPKRLSGSGSGSNLVKLSQLQLS